MNRRLRDYLVLWLAFVVYLLLWIVFIDEMIGVFIFMMLILLVYTILTFFIDIWGIEKEEEEMKE